MNGSERDDIAGQQESLGHVTKTKRIKKKLAFIKKTPKVQRLMCPKAAVRWS